LAPRRTGAAPGKRAERAARLMRDAGLVQVDVAEDDDGLWARQRAGQRSKTAALVLIATRPSRIAQVLRLTDSCGGTLVGRAALGTSYVECEPAAVERLRAGLPDGGWAFVLDGPLELRRDPWGAGEDGQALELMRRVKQRFDPARTCNPGVFVGGI
jgi:hypothetical protein